MRSTLPDIRYFILLALAETRMTGFDVQGQIVGDTVGGYVGYVTIYKALREMAQEGLVESNEGRVRVYRLTEEGRRKLELASRTYERAAQLAKQRLRYR